MKVVQVPRGDTANQNGYTGAQGQITYDTQTNQLRIHDGATAGGFPIPKVADLTNQAARLFSAVQVKSVPATPMTVADVGKLNSFTVGGTYTLMAANVVGVGIPFVVRAEVAGVTLQRAGADVIKDKGGSATSIVLTQYETVVMTQEDVGVFRIMQRY